MAFPSASMLPTFLLLLAFLLPQVIAAGIPANAKLATRDSLLAVSYPNAPAFTSSILDKVNTYRSYQDAPPLEYNADLANYANGLASSCDIESKVSINHSKVPF